MDDDDRRWWHRAACRDEDPELFHPVGNSGPALKQLIEAKAVCEWCPVRQECLADALADNLDHGVFGGMSADERRRLRRRGGRPPVAHSPEPPPPYYYYLASRETADLARQAIREGMTVQQAAAHFQVTVDTARRWRRKALLEDSEVAS